MRPAWYVKTRSWESCRRCEVPQQEVVLGMSAMEVRIERMEPLAAVADPDDFVKRKTWMCWEEA
jgi:hypothetical protein